MKLPWGGSSSFPTRVQVTFVDDPHADQGSTGPQKQILGDIAQIRELLLHRYGQAPAAATVPEHVAALIYHSGCRAQFVDMDTGKPWHP